MRNSGISTTPRVKEIMDLVALDKFSDSGKSTKQQLRNHLASTFENKKQFLRNVFADTSQNPSFKAWTNASGVTGCLSTSTCLYSYARDGPVLPFELMLLQGHRRDFAIPAAMSSSRLRDLAGEGICLPCLGTIVWALYLTKGLP